MEKKPKLELKEITKVQTRDFTKVVCPSCGTAGKADDININDKIAKCGQCNVVYSFQPSISPLLNTPSPKPEVLRPEGIDVYYFKDELDITMNQPISIFDAILAPSLFFFALLATASFFKKGEISAVIPALLWLGTIIPTINLIFSNRFKLYITADKRYLSIIRKPKRFKKDQHFAVDEIDQLFVRTKDGLFDLMLVVKTSSGAKQIPLIKRMHGISKARFLEQEIERHLQITDRPILEEVK
jgi:hypothetical protein